MEDFVRICDLSQKILTLFYLNSKYSFKKNSPHCDPLLAYLYNTCTWYVLGIKIYDCERKRAPQETKTAKTCIVMPLLTVKLEFYIRVVKKSDTIRFSSRLPKRGILLPKLFWLTYCDKKNSSDWEIFLKFKAEGQEFAKKIEINRTICSNSESSEQFFATERFLTCFSDLRN